MCHSKVSNFFEEVPKWKIIDLDTWFRIMTFRKIRKVLKFLILLAFQILITRNYRLDFFLEDPDQKIEIRGRVSISKSNGISLFMRILTVWIFQNAFFFWNSPKLILTLIRCHRLIFFFPTSKFPFRTPNFKKSTGNQIWLRCSDHNPYNLNRPTNIIFWVVSYIKLFFIVTTSFTFQSRSQSKTLKM